jgi:hypothetical protein
MDAPQTAGQAVRAALDKTLDAGMAWDEAELLTLAAIERATDRLAVFAARFEESAADPKSSPARLATLSGECRLLDGAIQKWTATLDPHNDTAKSLRHVSAANSRWHRHGT